MRNTKLYANKSAIGTLRQSVIIALFIMVLLVIPNITMTVKAVDIIVDDDPGVGDYDTIQAAINAASAGDTIWVKDGSYNEQLSITKSLAIISDNGAQPKIYASSYNPGITISASNVIFDGFKIYGYSGSLDGNTIRITAGSDIEIRNNEFTVISGQIGKNALLVSSGITGVIFDSNQVSNYEKGVQLSSGSQCDIVGNTFSTVNYSIYHAASISGTSTFYGSIQDAISNTDVGDTLSVSAGTFQEAVTIDKSLILKGQQYNENPAIEGRSGDESIIDGVTSSAITILAGTENVEINGFTLTIAAKNAAQNQGGIIISEQANTIIIKNNIVKNITDGSGADTVSDETYGIMVYGRNVAGGQSDITIEDNLIMNVEEYGIAINDNTSNVMISGNNINNLIGSDHSTDPIWDPAWPDIICSAVHLGGQVGPIYDITIFNNILSTGAIGDGLATAAGGGISFAGVAEWLPPNRSWAGFQEITVDDNLIFNNSMGIVCLAGASNRTLGINDNNISDNSQYGIYNLVDDNLIDATENWWGDISGPYNATDNPSGLGNEVIGNVTYWPWYEFDGYSIEPTVEYNLNGASMNNGEYISEDTQIEIIADDADSGLYSLTYRTWNATHRWSSWQTYTDEFTLYGEGKHLVQYNATDNAGTANIDTEEHMIDIQTPSVEVFYPNGGESLYGSVQIEWTAADKIRDQQQMQRNDSIALTEDYPGHIQSFKPTHDEIRSVQLLIQGGYANVSVKLYSSISPVPTPIGQSSKELLNVGNPGYPLWVDFPFSSDIELDPEETYYIGVTQKDITDIGFKWYLYNASDGTNAYEYGQAWIKETDSLATEPDWDFCFQTLYWDTDIDITVEYSMTGIAPWSTLAENENNDGSYTWNTEPYPDAESYRVRVVARDVVGHEGWDTSDLSFRLDNDGPVISNVVITDTTISNNEYCKNGDNVVITAQILGDPISISADLTKLGGGAEVAPTTFTGTTASWSLNSILCNPSNGVITVSISATDSSGDSSFNTDTIVSDNLVPEVIITRPGPGLYFLDSMRLLPFSYPFIIGQITIIADATDGDGSGIEKVEFYLEDDLESSASEPPFEWVWDRAATGFFTLSVKAYDNVGHAVTDEVHDMFIINLDILG